MKKYVCSLLVLILLLCGCTAQPAETTTPTTEPAHTEAIWVPYDGNSRNYVYYHTEERDRAWEEDILFFGDSYLEEYALLTHFPSRIEYMNDVEYSEEFYDPELRKTFIDEINGLILRISELSDTEILYELQRILALLHDAHTSLSMDWDTLFPIGFEVFWEEGSPVFYLTLVPEEYDWTVLFTLTGINGISLDEIITRMKPYISHENEYWLQHLISGGSHIGELANPKLLEIIGVTDGSSAVYNLVSDFGMPINIKLNSCSAEEWEEMDLAGHTHGGAYPEIYGGTELPNYFYRWMAEDNMMYIRVNTFYDMADYSFLEMGNDVLRELRDAGGVEKLVIDLRRNPGGYQFYGYPEFINALSRMEYETLYVLIDEGTFSSSILMAGRIKAQFPDTVLVGTPAGQPPNFFASMNDIDYVMPNCGVLCRMPTAYWCVMPDYEYDALMPDLTVYPTIEDYRNCVDTILEAVKAL